MPAGATVTPLPAAGGSYVIEVPVYLDNRVLARSTARFNSDQAARRGKAVA